MSDFGKRLARIERRLDQLDPANATGTTTSTRRICALCERPAVARGLCSAHYQQWRYRERKARLVQRANKNKDLDHTPELESTLLLSSTPVAADNN